MQGERARIGRTATLMETRDKVYELKEVNFIPSGFHQVFQSTSKAKLMWKYLEIEKNIQRVACRYVFLRY